MLRFLVCEGRSCKLYERGDWVLGAESLNFLMRKSEKAGWECWRRLGLNVVYTETDNFVTAGDDEPRGFVIGGNMEGEVVLDDRGEMGYGFGKLVLALKKMRLFRRRLHYHYGTNLIVNRSC